MLVITFSLLCEFIETITTRIHDILWRHQMATISALLLFCVGNSPVTREFPSQWRGALMFSLFAWTNVE